MIQLEGAGKTYEKRGQKIVALAATNLNIAAGEFVAIVGPSGSGKTTLLSLLGGMLAPSAGKMLLDGVSVYDLPVHERAKLRQKRIGFVFQTFNLIPYLSALENVQIPLMLSATDRKSQQEKAAELLTRLGLGERLDHKPGELSLGQQQRVAMARTLANDPAIILADEPTGNLDPATRTQILDYLTEFAKEGRTVVLVTHDMSAAELASRQLLLKDGKITPRFAIHAA